MKNSNFAVKILSSTLFIFPTLMISMMPVNAAPDLCKDSAITVKEKDSVDIPQNIYSLQSKLEIYSENLSQLNSQNNLYFNSGDTSTVSQYNKNVNESDELSKQYENQRDSYNTMINYLSPSTNIVLMNCLNSELISLEINTSSLNSDNLNSKTDNLI
ncbi:MAG: hypothetical protein KME09_19855 [Pleurocapsa minor HA4230-MV1]|jgi:preprotein translocase subunit SecF|nr:hypothetical protein [Pleurocapsa minor HA4230-MV1]